MANLCQLPPPGWWCSRTPGHDGPCVTRPQRASLEDTVTEVLEARGDGRNTEERS